MKKLKIEVYSFYFKITILSPRLSKVITSLTSDLVTFSFRYDKWKKRVVSFPDKQYFRTIKKNHTYAFSVNMLSQFMNLLGRYGVTSDDLDISLHKPHKPAKIKFNINKKYKIRDYQERYIDVLVNKDAKKFMLVDLRTGMGKGLISLEAIRRIKYKTLIMVKPGYIDKWISDLLEYTDITKDDIKVIKGYDALAKMIATKDTDYKFIIISLVTLRNYVRDYETAKNTDIDPATLLQKLKVGTVLNDETHQHFHSVYMLTLYLNANRFIGLSATLDNNDKQMRRMYEIIFPPDARINNLVKYEAYINVKAVEYELGSMYGLVYKRQQGYNHILYEQSIIRRSVLLKNYISMIEAYFVSGYLSRRTEGDKVLIFCASVHLATMMSNYFSTIYHDLTVNRYVEDDPYDNVVTGDVIISTPLSAGTALDIPNLITVLMTVSVSSLQSNKQAIGRLRKLKDKEVTYIYFYTKDIPNHIKMERDRYRAIKDIAKSYKYIKYDKVLKQY